MACCFKFGLFALSILVQLSNSVPSKRLSPGQRFAPFPRTSSATTTATPVVGTSGGGLKLRAADVTLSWNENTIDSDIQNNEDQSTDEDEVIGFVVSLTSSPTSTSKSLIYSKLMGSHWREYSFPDLEPEQSYFGALEVLRENEENNYIRSKFVIETPRSLKGDDVATVLRSLEVSPPDVGVSLGCMSLVVSWSTPNHPVAGYYLEVSRLSVLSDTSVPVQHLRVPGGKRTFATVPSLEAGQVYVIALREVSEAELVTDITHTAHVVTGRILPVLNQEKTPPASVNKSRAQHAKTHGMEGLGTKKHPVVCFTRDDRPFDGFPCDSEACIPAEWVCDGEMDCPGGDDEAECEPTTSTSCRVDQFQCPGRDSTIICLPKAWICDGDADCFDGSDEDPSNCALRPGASCQQYRCTNGVCVLDCSEDATLEQESPHSTRNCDQELEFQCYQTNDLCIIRQWVCDGVVDCPNSEDESSEICGQHQRATGGQRVKLIDDSTSSMEEFVDSSDYS